MTTTLSRCLRIDTDGTVTTFDLTAAQAARTEFSGNTEVVSLRGARHVLPYVVDQLDNELVGVVHGDGLYQGMRINASAWALYGGSPIVGPMYVAVDRNLLLPSELVEAITEKRHLTESGLAAMRRFLEHTPSYDGVPYLWPE